MIYVIVKQTNQNDPKDVLESVTQYLDYTTAHEHYRKVANAAPAKGWDKHCEILDDIAYQNRGRN